MIMKGDGPFHETQAIGLSLIDVVEKLIIDNAIVTVFREPVLP